MRPAGLLRFACNDSACHCEEQRDEAISAGATPQLMLLVDGATAAGTLLQAAGLPN
jgi:hypothetical protein